MPHLEEHSCRRIAAILFLGSTLITAVTLHMLDFNQLVSITSSIFIGVITAGIWLEVSFRFLVKEATAPLDKLIEKL